MKLIIDIPEQKYKTIQEGMYCGMLDADLYRDIKNGTPFYKLRAEIDELEIYKEQMCDHFCRVPREASDEEETEALCSICPLNKLQDISESINDLRRAYINEIENLEEDAKDNNSLCNTYIQGKLAAYSNVLKDLEELSG